MRYFPSAQRRPVAVMAAGVASVALLFSSLTANSFAEDGLDERQDRVEKKIDDAADELEHASEEARQAANKFARAEASLAASQAQLAAAKDQLAEVKERLGEAKRLDALAAQRLLEAEHELQLSRVELTLGRKAVAIQRDDVADQVATTYEQGDPSFVALTSIVQSKTLDDVTRGLAAREAIVERGNRIYDELADAKGALTAQKERVKEDTLQVEEQREQAAARVIKIGALTEEAAAAKKGVRELVNSSRGAKKATQDARASAFEAREADAQALRELEEREQRIRQLVLASASKSSRTFSGETGGLLNYPVNGSITSPFGYRTHPIYGYYGLHNGTDFGAGCGSSLYASADGTVINSYYDSVYGNRLYVNIGQVNGQNMTLVYNHATSYSVGNGAKVSRGQVIGSVGSTGWSTGCHLHYTVLLNGDPVDPAGYL